MRTWLYGLPFRPIVKCEIDLHNSTLACSEQNSLSGYCQVSSRLSVIILGCKWSIWVVPWESLPTTSYNAIVGDLELTRQCPSYNAMVGDLELTRQCSLSEFRFERRCCVNPLHISLHHIALVAILLAHHFNLHWSLITYTVFTRNAWAGSQPGFYWTCLGAPSVSADLETSKQSGT